MEIRTIEETDYHLVDQLIKESFTNSENGYEGEAELVQNIREEKTYNSSLEVVAVMNDKIVGHALLSEVHIEDENDKYIGLALAPIEVLTSHQKSGIGTKLMSEVEYRAKDNGYKYISVMGWPDYYSKFGYTQSVGFNIYPPFKDIPKEVYLIKELEDGYLRDKQGTIIYSQAFE